MDSFKSRDLLAPEAMLEILPHLPGVVVASSSPSPWPWKGSCSLCLSHVLFCLLLCFQSGEEKQWRQLAGENRCPSLICCLKQPHSWSWEWIRPAATENTAPVTCHIVFKPPLQYTAAILFVLSWELAPLNTMGLSSKPIDCVLKHTSI